MAPVTPVLKKTGVHRFAEVVYWLYWDLSDISTRFAFHHLSFQSPFGSWVLGAWVFMCFSHGSLGLCVGYDVGASGAASYSEEHCFRDAFSWFVLEGALMDLGLRRSCWGEGHDKRCDRQRDCLKACVMSQKKGQPKAEQIYFIPTAAQGRLTSQLLRQEFTTPS